MIGDRGDLKNIEFGEGYCRLGDEEITLCHECIGRKVCWNAQLEVNDEATKLDTQKAIDLEFKPSQMPSVYKTAPDSPGEKTE